MNRNTIIRILIILIFSIQFNLLSQNSSNDNYKEFVVSGNYNAPLGKLKWVYKAAPGIQVGINWVNDEYEDERINKIGVNIGILQFKPKEDTLYYLVPPDSYGTAVFSNYQMVTATFHIENIKRFDKFGLTAGGDAGLAFIKYSSFHKDKNIDLGEESIEGKLIISPQIGLYYELTQDLRVSLVTQYNSLISLGSTDSESANYNSNAGTYRQFASIYLKVGYTF